MAVGVVLLGNALAQTPATKTQTPPAKKPAAPPLKQHLPLRRKPEAAQGVTALTTDKQKASYAIGMNWGTGLHRQGIDVDSAALIQGMKDALGGGKTLLTEDEARAALMKLQSEMQAKQQSRRNKRAKPTKRKATRIWPPTRAKRAWSLCPAVCNTRF